MTNLGLTGFLAKTAIKYKFAVLFIWIVLFIGGGYFAAGINEYTENDQGFVTEPESEKALALYNKEFSSDSPVSLSENIIIKSLNNQTVNDAEFKSTVSNVTSEIRALESSVAFATNFYETNLPNLISKDQSITLIPVELKGTFENSALTAKPYVELIHELDSKHNNFDILTSGFASIDLNFVEVAEDDLASEIQVMPIALIVLLFVFGALVASVIPILLGLIAIVITIGLCALISRVYPLNIFVTNIVLTIGLAVGIDYALFIMDRFREERSKGLEKIDAITKAGSTSSRAVLFSGFTVVLSLLGMFLVPTDIFRSLGLGAIIVVVVSILSSLTLLPAILAILGDGINRLKVPFIQTHNKEESKFWSSIALNVMKYKIIGVIIPAVVLVLISSQYFNITIGASGVETLPEDNQARKAYEILEENFLSGGIATPIIVVAQSSSNEKADMLLGFERLNNEINASNAFGPILGFEASKSGLAYSLQVAPKGSATSGIATDSVDLLRNTLIPQSFGLNENKVLVGGQSAGYKDFYLLVDRFTPIVFIFVLSTSFLLLLVVFRSIFVPIKAVIMNMLGVGTAYGLMYLVFEKGYAINFFGFQQVESIEAWVPLFLFTIVFGLSMDYEVFLLSRIREHFDATGNNAESVAHGIKRTGRLITGAAGIMIVVFSGFAMGELTMFQQMGFGIGVAVLIDATIIRMVFVPASMALADKWNWYFPSWLNWIPDVRVEPPENI